MSGEKNLIKLLKNINPELKSEVFVFCTTKDNFNFNTLDPISVFKEEEGVTLVLEKDIADKYCYRYEGTYQCITLKIHSSLEAIGLTAAVSTKLAEHNISANVIAGYYHDHIFIPVNKAKDAMEALKELTI